MGRKKVRIPIANEVRFELVAYARIVLRKTVQTVVGPGEVADVDVGIDMSLAEWDALRKAIKKARSRKKEKLAKKMTTIPR